eukprot:10022948-Lingulodinium_polyedra.AAC.1
MAVRPAALRGAPHASPTRLYRGHRPLRDAQGALGSPPRRCVLGLADARGVHQALHDRAGKGTAGGAGA